MQGSVMTAQPVICTHHHLSTKLHISPVQINDILIYIFLNLSPLELSSTISLVSSAWNKLVINNKLLWLFYCDVLWKGKFFIHAQAMKLKQSKPVEAFKMSWLDRQRNVIHFNELTSMKWQFRFKWNVNNGDKDRHQNAQLMLAQFNIDGTLIHENVDFHREFRWRFIKGPDTQQSDTDTFDNFDNFDRFQLRRTSRFSTLNEFDILAKKSGNYDIQTNYGYDEYSQFLNNTNQTLFQICKSRWIKVNQFPPLCAFRDNNWGWILENEHVIFTSY